MSRYSKKNKNIFRPSRTALTLIEMLLTLSFLSLTGLAAYQALSSGIKVWERGRQITVEGDVAIFLDKITTDLRNAFPYSQIESTGTSDQLAFPTLVYVPEDKRRDPSGQAWTHQIGQVRYSLSKPKAAIIREEANYSQALKKKVMMERILVSPIKDLRFDYCYFQRGGTMSIESDMRNGIPQAVRVSVGFSEKSGKAQAMQRFIFLPWQG